MYKSTVLFLCFQLGNHAYALNTDPVHSLAPVLPARPVPGAPAHVRGLVEYRSEIAPLIDLCHLVTGKAAASLLSTRMIMVHYAPGDGRSHLLGLIAEKVLDTVSVSNDALCAPGIEAPDTGYLGQLFKNTAGVWVQTVEPEALLPDELKKLLFPR